MRRWVLMPPSNVLTFEATDRGPALMAESPSLAEASTLLPTGAYSTLRTYGGRGIVRFERHLLRLEESATLQGHPAAIDREAARRLVVAALDLTRHPESRLRLTFAPPRLFVSVEAFVPLPPSLYEGGVACVVLPRLHRDRPRVKDTRFIAAARRTYHELPPGVEEGLLVAENGDILEGLSSNFFAVVDGALHTEEHRVLSGITRELVIEAAETPLTRRAVSRRQLGRLSEAFITSASRGVLPVVRIDGVAIGDGRVGRITRDIADRFADLVHLEAVALVEP